MLQSKEIKLPAPSKTGGRSVMETLWRRQATREGYDKKALDEQTLSDLLWAATGISRPDSGLRTNPTACNYQEISVYAFNGTDVRKYNPVANTLELVVEGDHRKLLAAGQDFVERVPTVILIVADVSQKDFGTEKARLFGGIDAGIVSENINLFCAANDLKTVTRAYMDTDAISKLLVLSEYELPMLNNPVGY